MDMFIRYIRYIVVYWRIKEKEYRQSNMNSIEVIIPIISTQKFCFLSVFLYIMLLII